MKRTFSMVAVIVSLCLTGCGWDGTGRGTSTTSQTRTDRTTITQSPAVNAHAANPAGRGTGVNVDLDDRAAVPADGAVAGQDRVNVSTTPGGGVNVNVKGQPARDLIRERREARREATIPR